MPLNEAEVDQLLTQLKEARDAMDASADTTAASEQALAVTLESEAATEEDSVISLRVQSSARDARDVAGRVSDAQAIKSLVGSTNAKKQQASQLARNAARKLSLKHDKEKASDKEICVNCVAMLDDNGDIIGATHHRFSIEDRQVIDSKGQPATLKGLRNKLKDDEADLDPADGRLRVGGKRVGKD